MAHANTLLAVAQQGVTAWAHTAAMDAVWQRLDEELSRRNKSWAWLAGQLGYSRARCANWKARGVPVGEFPALAVALGQSVDWVAGFAPARKETGVEPSPMAARLAAEFDQIRDPAAQLDAFAKIVAIITRARGET